MEEKIKNTCKGVNRRKEPCQKKTIDESDFCFQHQNQKDYTDEMMKKLVAPKCKAIVRNGGKCRRSSVNETGFCGWHQYMVDYTDEMLESLTQCGTCKKMFYIPTGRMCEKCKRVASKNREKARNKNVQCKKESCTFKKSKENDYCGQHQINYFLEQVEERGKKPCANYNRKCRVELDKDYKYSKCQDCLLKDRIKDNERFNKKKGINVQKVNDGCSKLVCIVCNTEKNIDEFINGNGKLGDKCTKCLDKQNKYLKDRRAKITQYTDTYILYVYKETTRKRLKRTNNKDKYTWNLDDEYAIELFNSECTYCGHSRKKESLLHKNHNYHIGIDRIDNNKCYMKGNVTPCCQICNMMKYTHDVDDFLTYCENIINNCYCNEQCEYEGKRKYTSYNKYKHNAKKRNIDFELSRNKYDEMICKKCYYCGDTNNKGIQIGIDRVNSDLCYSDKNTVSACYICNVMKKQLSIKDFYNHLLQILSHNKKITLSKYNKKLKKSKKHKKSLISKEWLKERLINDFNKSKDKANKSEELVNNSNITTFLHDEKYYLSKIYNTNNIDDFIPEIEFCETYEQKDIWMYYRLKISSFPYTSTVCRVIKMLIRDKTTKKYVGFTSLGSDIIKCKSISDYIGWNNSDKIVHKKMNNVMNITTCISIPPFSFNFNGGKLMAQLMFSKKVSEYFENKYNDKLAGIATFSLNGKGVQYDRLKELKYIGLTSGYGASHIDNSTYEYIKQYMKENDMYKKYKSRMHMLYDFCNHLEINNLSYHGNQRGVYFGYTGSNSKKFLCNESDDFVPDYIKSVNDIGTYWKNRWAKQRYNHLLKTDRLMLKANYNKNYVSEKEYDKIQHVKQYRKNKEKFDKTNKYLKLTDGDKIEIIKYWNDNKDKSMLKLEKELSEKLGKKIDRRKIKKIINS